MRMILFIIALIIFIIIQGIILYASECEGVINAGDRSSVRCEEVRATWERESDSKITGDSVLAALNRSDKGHLSLNAFCSEESFSRVSELRKLAAGIIHAGMSGSVSGNERFAGMVLLRISDISVSTLTVTERWLVYAAESLPNGVAIPCSGFCSAGAFPELLLFTPSFVFTVQGSSRNCHGEIKSRSNNIRITVVLSRELFDNEHADIYRLFLYLKDSSGNGDSDYIAYTSLFSLIPPFAAAQFYQHRAKPLKTFRKTPDGGSAI